MSSRRDHSLTKEQIEGIATALRAARASVGLTQSDWAEAISTDELVINKTSVCRYERGEKVMPQYYHLMLGQAFPDWELPEGLTISDLPRGIPHDHSGYAHTHYWKSNGGRGTKHASPMLQVRSNGKHVTHREALAQANSNGKHVEDGDILTQVRELVGAAPDTDTRDLVNAIMPHLLNIVQELARFAGWEVDEEEGVSDG